MIHQVGSTNAHYPFSSGNGREVIEFWENDFPPSLSVLNESGCKLSE